jgi:signal recognition particle receptor subunit beta
MNHITEAWAYLGQHRFAISLSVAFVALVALLIVLVDLEMAQYKEERRIMAMRKARRW